MRITKISVKGLFGMFDHEIPLNQESRITIVHGPNGVGKTVLMRMVLDLFHGSCEVTARTPFEEFRIEFENGSLYVEKSTDSRKLTFRYKEVPDTEFEHFVLKIPRFDDWFDYDPLEDGPEWIWQILDDTKIEFIHTLRLQEDLFDRYGLPTLRLDDFHEDSTMPTVSKIFQESIMYYENAPDWSQSDMNLFDIALLLKNNNPSAAAQFRGDEPTVEAEQGKPLPSASQRKLWQILWSKVEEWGQGDPYFQELMLFLEIIDERILFKSLDTTEPGFEFKFKANDGNEIPFSSLSSGEQHLLFLYYQLLFIVRSDTLVMIDEPEISMNVVWQRRFLDDLERIIELRNFDVLIATHSPQIISDKWDWMIPLGESESDDDGKSK
ncbi:MAG: AAA family ATPase [Chloroflexi bacterium]|nr:AAA family ATPase [Chloroflexota bacterium]